MILNIFSHFIVSVGHFKNGLILYKTVFYKILHNKILYIKEMKIIGIKMPTGLKWCEFQWH